VSERLGAIESEIKHRPTAVRSPHAQFQSHKVSGGHNRSAKRKAKHNLKCVIMKLIENRTVVDTPLNKHTVVHITGAPALASTTTSQFDNDSKGCECYENQDVLLNSSTYQSYQSTRFRLYINQGNEWASPQKNTSLKLTIRFPSLPQLIKTQTDWTFFIFSQPNQTVFYTLIWQGLP